MLWVALVCHQLTKLSCTLSNSWHLFQELTSLLLDANLSWLYRNIRKKDVTKFHIQLALSKLLILLSSLINYIFFLQYRDIHFVRTTHLYSCFIFWYHILVVAMWMGAEGFLSFKNYFSFSRKSPLSTPLLCLWYVGVSLQQKEAIIMQAALYWTAVIKTFCSDNVSCLFLTASTNKQYLHSLHNDMFQILKFY